MTKDYHITPEQADALALKVSPECKYVSAYELYPESLTAIINAALDKVLGEPVGKVGDIAPDRFPPLHGFIFNAPAEAFQLGTKLYAPKDLK